jgi:hypothetical protein
MWSIANEVLKWFERLFGEPVVEDIRGGRLWYEWNATEAYIANQIPHVRDKEDVPHEHAIPDFYGLAEGF